jgi:hypothetical protein
MKRQSRNCFDLLPAKRSQSRAFNMEYVDRRRRSEYEKHACARRDARGSNRRSDIGGSPSVQFLALPDRRSPESRSRAALC